jgi:autotransporter-associated beta strand protein
VSSITDNQDGTYTAVYNPGSTAAGTVTLTPAINGVNFTNSLQINIVNELSLPSAPDGMRVSDDYATGSNGITFGLGLGIEYVVVGGGGAGGRLGGGGGAGEFLEGNQVVFDGVSNTVVVGNGGQTSSANGDDSRFNASVAKGGGGGGNIGARGKSGGSGGGGSRSTDGGIDGLGNTGGSSTKSTGFGNAGGQSRGYAGEHLKGGGGGGAGAAGETAPAGTTRSGNGGIGTQSSITGIAAYYAAGGGGGAGSSISAAGQGGLGGGGNGGRGAASVGADGTSNTGSGGGGGGSTGGSGAAGGKGGSGVVFVRYPGSADLATGGLESAITAGGKPYRLHSFTSTGSSSLTFSLGAFDFSSYSSEIAGIVSGGGPITFNSTGKLRLTGANTYTGSTTIASGTLEVGDGGTTGNLGSGGVINNGSLIFNRSNSLAFANAISGTGSLAQIGAGMLILSGTSYSYTGSTSVSAGHLRINSTITSSSGVTVASGATLSGTGTLPTTTVSGTHAPGTSPGVQSITGDLTYTTGATFEWELIANDATATDRGVDYDGVDVSGVLTIQTGVTSSLVFNGAGSTVDWTDAFWSSNRSWLVFDNAATPTVSGTIFGTINVSTDINGAQLTSVTGRSNAAFYWSMVGDDIFLNYVANTVLPVSWKSFTGREKNGHVELNWETASEQNTKDFVVEHSTNAIGWKAIGSVSAAGSSSSIRSYSFLHSQPSMKNYYRLLQRDLDGKQSYSSIVNVNVAELLSGIRILGNPVKNKQLVIQLEKAATIVIHSTSGQQIYQGRLEAGMHRINLPAAPGLYNLKAGMHRIPFLLE